MTETFTAVKGEPPGVFVTDNGMVGKFRTLTGTDVLSGGRIDPVKLEQVAQQVVDDLQRNVQIGTSKRDVQVIVDMSAVGLQPRLWLEQSIARKLAAPWAQQRAHAAAAHRVGEGRERRWKQ